MGGENVGSCSSKWITRDRASEKFELTVLRDLLSTMAYPVGGSTSIEFGHWCLVYRTSFGAEQSIATEFNVFQKFPMSVRCVFLVTCWTIQNLY